MRQVSHVLAAAAGDGEPRELTKFKLQAPHLVNHEHGRGAERIVHDDKRGCAAEEVRQWVLAPWWQRRLSLGGLGDVRQQWLLLGVGL